MRIADDIYVPDPLPFKCPHDGVMLPGRFMIKSLLRSPVPADQKSFDLPVVVRHATPLSFQCRLFPVDRFPLLPSSRVTAEVFYLDIHLITQFILRFFDKIWTVVTGPRSVNQVRRGLKGLS